MVVSDFVFAVQSSDQLSCLTQQCLPGGWVDGAGELKLELEVLIVKVVDLDNGSVGFVFNLGRVSKQACKELSWLTVI